VPKAFGLTLGSLGVVVAVEQAARARPLVRGVVRLRRTPPP